MRIYEGSYLKKAICNKCGKEMQNDKGYVTEGEATIDVKWGYFSNKDLQEHLFDLCEVCYDEIISKFKIPVEVKEYITVENVE